MRYQRSIRLLLPVAAEALPACAAEVRSACIPGGYPEAPSDASTTLYVSARCPVEGENGTKRYPYRSIAHALQRASPGATLLLAAGEYPERLKIEQDVSIIGPSDPARPEREAAVLTPAAEPNSTCSGAEIGSAIVICGDSEVTLRGLVVRGATGAGIAVNAASVRLEESTVEDTDRQLEMYGYGVFAAEGASLSLKDSVIRRSGAAGLLIAGAEASVLRTTLSDNAAAGLYLSDAIGPVAVSESAIDDNTEYGIFVVASTLTLQKSAVRRTASATSGGGYGIAAISAPRDGEESAPVDIALLENEIDDNDGVGVYFAEGIRGAVVEGNLIRDNGFDSPSGGGGLLVAAGLGDVAANRIERNTIVGNRLLGLGLSGRTYGVPVEGNTIEGTKLGVVFDNVEERRLADGITVVGGASARIVGNRIRKNERCGLILDAATWSETSIQNNLIEGNGSYGIVLQSMVEAPTMSGNVVRGNASDEVMLVGGELLGSWPSPTRP